MLSTLLPGIREVRAPLAAGTLWALAAWILWEPLVPSAADAKQAAGVAHSLYRLHEVVPPLALGAAAGFLVYLLGSLSIALLSDSLRALFRVSISRSRENFNALTPAALSALYRVARETRQDIEASLAPIGASLPEFLNDALELPFVETRQSPLGRFIRKLWSSLEGVQSYRRRRQRTIIMRHAPAPPPEAATEPQLVDLAVRDLDTVTTARLLGKDQQLYSAIDRRRAELEFRLAVIPPLTALFAAISFRAPSSVANTLLFPLALAAMFGLFWDALRHQREAHGLLIAAAADGRVRFPTLERLLTNARSLTEMTSQQTAWLVERQLDRAIVILGKLDSFPSSALAASEAVARTERLVQPLVVKLEEPLRVAASRSLATLRDAAGLWSNGVNGRLDYPWTETGAKALGAARKALDDYRNCLRALGAPTAPDSVAVHRHETAGD
jgi:hypothetical protein